MSDVIPMPFRKASDPKALLMDVAEKHGDNLEKVLIVCIGKDERFVAASHGDEELLLVSAALVSDLANCAVKNGGSLDEEES